MEMDTDSHSIWFKGLMFASRTIMMNSSFDYLKNNETFTTVQFRRQLILYIKYTQTVHDKKQA